MRKIVAVTGLCLLLSGAAWAGEFQLFGTYGEITGSDRSLGAGVRVSLGAKSVMFDLTATWLPVKSTDQITEVGAPVTDDLRVTPLELGVRFLLTPGPGFRPYVGAGASYFVVSAGSGDADDELGYYVVGGFTYGGAGGARLFGEAVYRSATSNVSYPGHGGTDIDVGGLAVSLGLGFAF